MPDLRLPGARTGLVLVWAIVLSPMLLLAAGVALLVIGLWRDVDSVAAIGAIGIVGSLVLPRVQGAFEIGTSGIKADLEDDIYRSVIQQARDRGVAPEEAIELATDATARPVATLHQTWPDQWNQLYQMYGSHRLAATRALLAHRLANEFVGETVRLERECAAIVERVADEKGWDVRREVRRVGPGGESHVFDFLITTRTGSNPVFIETANFREPQAVSDKVAAISAVLGDQGFLAAFLVIPNTRAAGSYVPDNLKIVPVGDLERQLREIPAESIGPGGEPNA
jgi:hypothetical protein